MTTSLIRLLSAATLLTQSSLSLAVGMNLITVTFNNGTIDFSTTSHGSANYVVAVNTGVIPRNAPLAFSLTSTGSSAGLIATQQTSGASPCTGVSTICASSFSLKAGESCCLAFSLTSSKAGNYSMRPRIATTPAAYPAEASSTLPVTVRGAPAASYPGIYVETNNSLVTYSPDKGVNWGVMLSPQGGWYWNLRTWATAITADGTMFQATGVQGNSIGSNGAATLIYSSDGVTWKQVNTFPTNNDGVQSLFAVGNTVYVGTGNGYVYYTSNQGTTWVPIGAQVPDAKTVNAIVVDANGNYYAGTSGGNLYYFNRSNPSWTLLPQQLTGSSSISSLAIDSSGTLYAVTTSTTTQPQYNSAPLTTGTWQLMSALPGSDGNATAIAASGATVYVGTSTSYILYTSNKGATWLGGPLPSGDTSGVTSLFANQATSLSPLFVESYGSIQINSGQGTGSVAVRNLSSTTATNVHANPSQLPANVTQTSSACASVAPGGSCTITFSVNGTGAFNPTAFDVIDGNGTVIARSALVSQVTPDSGSNYYYVYNVNGITARVLDNSDASSGIIWSSDNSGSYDGGVAIYGISEISTISSPNPSTGMITEQAACNGATDGSCNANNVHVQYSTIPPSYYAEGLCYQSTNGNASSGAWYLPAACELNGGIYLDVTNNQFASCSPVLTSVFSLYSLGALGGSLAGLQLNASGYWSSTEYAGFYPQFFAWCQFVASGGASDQGFNGKNIPLGVRCSRALPI